MSSYHTVAVSQTAQELAGPGQSGSKGDIITRIIVNVDTAATGTVAILDGAVSIPLTSANIAIGTYYLELGAVSQNGAWSVTTGAGASAIVVGDFNKNG